MYKIGNWNVFVGDFHGQWTEPDENLSLNLSALTVCGYDFSLYNSGDTSPSGPFATLVRKLDLPFTVLPYGKELFYDWAHLMLGGLKPGAEIPALNDPDFFSVLRRLRPQCDFLSIAHPWKPFYAHLDHILDENLVDAVAFNHADDEDLLCWYHNRLKSGKTAPIVTELDFHATLGRRSGSIHYQTLNEAFRDLAPVGKRYTLVFAEECTPECLYAAVRAGRSVVDLDGILTGPDPLVELLKNNDYFHLKQSAQEEREKLKLTLPAGSIPMEQEPLTVHINGKSVQLECLESSAVNQPCFYYPVAASGQCRVIRGQNAVTGRLRPRSDGSLEVDLANHSLTRSYAGYFQVDAAAYSCKETFSALRPGERRSFPLKDFSSPSGLPSVAKLTLFPDGLPPRHYQRDLFAVGIPYASEPDPVSPGIVLDRPEQLDPMWSSEWDGPEDSSMVCRTSWNEEGLHFRFDVTDSKLAPSSRPEQLYCGDCIQLALNPCDRPDMKPFSFYHFIATRGAQPEGDERCIAYDSPQSGLLGTSPTPYRLPSWCYRLEMTDPRHSILHLTLPWNLLPLFPAGKGTRFQMHLILWDNDGTGIKSALQWPRPGMWYQPDDWTWSDAELL